MCVIDLGLSQIFPVLDPTTEEELTVIHSAFCDPYLLIIRNDSSVQILQVDKGGDLDELEAGEDIASAKWLSGCIYKSHHTHDAAMLFLLTPQGALQVDMPLHHSCSLCLFHPRSMSYQPYMRPSTQLPHCPRCRQS